MNQTDFIELVRVMKSNNDVLGLSDEEMIDRALEAFEFLQGLSDDK